MRHPVLKAVFTASVAALFSPGCGSDTPSSASSFTKVYAEVIQPQCSNEFCHFSGVSIRYSALDLSSKIRAYWSLVDVPSLGPACSQSGLRVVPWRPEESIFYKKLAPTPPCGTQMPADVTTFSTNGSSELKFSGHPLPVEQQQLIHDWIAEGAAYN
ncbi:MAG: hypothetical protein ABJA82_02350 [Myxococcales bacterium]